MCLHRQATSAAAALTFLLAAGCATAPVSTTADGWHDVAIPGKTLTQYRSSTKDGRPAVAAKAEQSASMWRRRVDRAPGDIGEVSFSWWVQDLVENGSVADVSREDAAARVIFAFKGDVSRLPPRTRAMFDLAEALTGERPPFATLMYVWDATAPVGTVIVNPRSDRIRKIVVDSGPVHLRRWREHRRNLLADYRRAFGEDPGALAAIALMTDSDNTASRAQSWYGPVDLH
jgi:Protein of unknown function (DUF3047)